TSFFSKRQAALLSTEPLYAPEDFPPDTYLLPTSPPAYFLATFSPQGDHQQDRCINLGKGTPITLLYLYCVAGRMGIDKQPPDIGICTVLGLDFRLPAGRVPKWGTGRWGNEGQRAKSRKGKVAGYSPIFPSPIWVLSP